MKTAPSPPLCRAIPLSLIVLCALAFHGPLLLMRLPDNSFDAHFHMSMAAHYAEHWFDPWNAKSLGGFSETTYPPLTHQWTAIFSHVVGLSYGFMLVLGIMILLLPVAVYRFSKLWVDERAASYGALCSVFLGSLSLLAYQDGQIGTISATTLFLLAIPYAFDYAVTGSRQALILGVALSCTAAAAHHATLLFGLPFFVLPTIWLALRDYRTAHPGDPIATPAKRIALFTGLVSVGILFVLLPYFLSILKNPIEQTPIPHLSRANFLLEPKWGLHYWLVPMGALVLALPYILYKGAQPRLRPLFFGFYGALLFGLGGTTPVPRWILRRAFEILTFERFTYWALLLAMPFVGLLAARLIDRFRVRGAVALVVAAVGSGALAVAWNVYFPLIGAPLNVDPVIKFLNENGHDRYRYLTLGFGNSLSKIACYSDAPSVDGEYNSGRTLPEMTLHGSAQLSSAKYYGSEGMLALSAMLRHATRYGLKYVFVADSYYEPILTFAGWRQIVSYDHGSITVWTNPGIPFARPIPSPFRPPRWQGIMWGTVPVGISLITIILALLQSRRLAGRATESLKPEESLVAPPLSPAAAPVLSSEGRA
ncbi:MAG TPA: hypothetical protein VGS27_29780 [Candidatus Sulfotelmatobacter sp.]|nr:hypothetical protein [Candidatus Sulfotelmatobacter sp.]